MIKFIYLSLLILSSCNSVKHDKKEIYVSVLRGPSALVFAKWMDEPPVINGRPLIVKLIDSPELIQAAMIKGETELAVLPMISAVNLYNKGVRYSLAGCPVWGTLYLVGKTTTNLAKEKTIHIFGAGTTPDVLTRYYLKQHDLECSLNYSFATAREIMQGLLAGKIETAVLGEPFLSRVLRKDSSFHIIADLNNPGGDMPGFAQTAIVYAPCLYNERKTIDSLLQISCRFATNQPEKVIRILEDNEVFAPGMLTPESIERCKIQYLDAEKARESVFYLLRLIEQYEPKAIGGKLPDSNFITGKQ